MRFRDPTLPAGHHTRHHRQTTLDRIQSPGLFQHLVGMSAISRYASGLAATTSSVPLALVMFSLCVLR
jgi:hypothetical protein